MTKEKSDKADGGKFRFAQYIPQTIILGIVLAVATIGLLSPDLWKNYSIPILLIAAGLAIPFLFSPWKFWAGYGVQVGIVPWLAFIILTGVFAIFFGYGIDRFEIDYVLYLIQSNLIILILWSFLVFVIPKISPKTWKDYGWIVPLAMSVLMFLIDVSWAKSTIENTTLEKSRLVSVPSSNPRLYVAYPHQIIYDEQNNATIMLWSANNVPCTLKNLRLSSDLLVFAFEPTDGSPFQWQRAIEIKMPDVDSMVSVHVQPLLTTDDAQEVFFEVTINDEEPQQLPPIRLEGRREAQARSWKNALLDASSISIIIGIVGALIEMRRKEEEERKKKEDEARRKEEEDRKTQERVTNHALENFDAIMQINLSEGIAYWEQLTGNWEKWNRFSQDQLRDKFSAFVEDNIWDALAGKALEEIGSDVANCLKLCRRIFENEKAKPIRTLNQLQSALRLDEQAPVALLSLLKEVSSSINTAKIIASAFSPALKAKTITDHKDEFLNQIHTLRIELGFIDTESFPLQAQFTFYTKPHISEDRLTAWLKAHELECSPFADADSPFYSVFGEQLLIDWAAPGFALPFSSLSKSTFEFKNSWDAGAGLFEYCKTLQSNVRIKENVLFVIITPRLVENYGADHPKRLYLHALAEQWIWSLAEAPTLFYALKDAQRDLAGRLLRWHDFSPSITVNKIVEFSRHLQKSKKEREREDEKNQKVFFSKISEWLTDASADDLRTEEINTLIGLRPSPKQRTVFLIPTIDLNPYVTEQISSSLHETMNEQSNWLSAHDCGIVHFLAGDKNQQTVPLTGLVNQCNIRVQKCSKTGNVEFNQFFDAPGVAPDAILARKAEGSPGRMVRLGQKLLLQHVQKYPPDEPLHIEDLEALEG
ncbi:MAG TPA: hypothetical protein VNK49_04805 [Anaerolineales bacterium]|nr:hypothetical protein [Anaerolineales bacterium]